MAMLYLLQIGFINVTLWDLLDVLIVGYLLFQIYKLLKGSLGFNIFLGLVLVYIVWWMVAALGMPLLSTILGQFISVGMIALLILFQPEVRRFLIFVGQGSFQSKLIERLLNRDLDNASNPQKEHIIREIVRALEHMSAEKIGSLLILSNGSSLEGLYSSGIVLNAEISSQLIISIFSKESPLHDGAAILANNKIEAASCVLPVSDKLNIPQELGLRHRAAIGVSETTNVVVFVVSEETGKISFSRRGEITRNLSPEQVSKILRKTIF